MYGCDWTKTGLPSEVTINELDDGMVERRPVTQVIVVEVLADTGQLIPSMVTVTEEPKLVPVMVIVVPPIEGPNNGETFVTVDVLE